MKNPIGQSLSGYFEELGALYTRTEATGAEGEALSLEDAHVRAIELIRAGVSGGGKVMFIGNGGSAAIASHMAIDYWKNGGLRAMAFNDGALLTCLGNDFGYSHVFEKPIEMFGQSGDVLVAISSSGRSENILAGARAAANLGCEVLTCSGFAPDNPLRSLGAVNFYVPSDSYGFVEISHLTLCHSILDCGFTDRSSG